MFNKRGILTAMALVALAPLVMGNGGCSNDADVVSRNLSQEADNFRVGRRVVFYNGFTNDYMLEIRGLCSLAPGTSAKSITVTCKAPDGYKKHILGLSDNVTYFVEQLNSSLVSPNFYQVTFKPTTIIPDIKLEVR